MLNQSFAVKEAWLVWHLLNSQPRFPGKLSQSFPLRMLLSLGWQISSSYANHALAAIIQQGCRMGNYHSPLKLIMQLVEETAFAL